MKEAQGRSNGTDMQHRYSSLNDRTIPTARDGDDDPKTDDGLDEHLTHLIFRSNGAIERYPFLQENFIAAILNGLGNGCSVSEDMVNIAVALAKALSRNEIYLKIWDQPEERRKTLLREISVFEDLLEGRDARPLRRLRIQEASGTAWVSYFLKTYLNDLALLGAHLKKSGDGDSQGIDAKGLPRFFNSDPQAALQGIQASGISQVDAFLVCMFVQSAGVCATRPFDDKYNRQTGQQWEPQAMFASVEENGDRAQGLDPFFFLDLLKSYRGGSLNGIEEGCQQLMAAWVIQFEEEFGKYAGRIALKLLIEKSDQAFKHFESTPQDFRELFRKCVESVTVVEKDEFPVRQGCIRSIYMGYNASSVSGGAIAQLVCENPLELRSEKLARSLNDYTERFAGRLELSPIAEHFLGMVIWGLDRDCEIDPNHLALAGSLSKRLMWERYYLETWDDPRARQKAIYQEQSVIQRAVEACVGKRQKNKEISANPKNKGKGRNGKKPTQVA